MKILEIRKSNDLKVNIVIQNPIMNLIQKNVFLESGNLWQSKTWHLKFDILPIITVKSLLTIDP